MAGAGRLGRLRHVGHPRGLNAVRRRLGFGYWSLSGWLKDRVKAAVKFVDDFERALAAEDRRRDVCGVICGHVHKPEIRTVDQALKG